MKNTSIFLTLAVTLLFAQFNFVFASPEEVGHWKAVDGVVIQANTLSKIEELLTRHSNAFRSILDAATAEYFRMLSG